MSDTNDLVPFDATRPLVEGVLKSLNSLVESVDLIYLIRDMTGRVRIVASDSIRGDKTCRDALERLANRFHETLGAHSHAPEDGVLFVGNDRMEMLKKEALPFWRNVFWLERLMTGSDWWTISDPASAASVSKTTRYTLFSVKGGVGRSTTVAVLGRHLADGGERVLIVDLDLESPGLSSAMLGRDEQPEFGVTDWFVEDLVDQGDRVVDRMGSLPAWSQDLSGSVYVVPAHGREPGEYLAKLGRVYMDERDTPWGKRLDTMITKLEARYLPTVVLIESRSGLHDIAATAVTDLDAEVLLFALNSESHWDDYGILFRHWEHYGLSKKIRERLSIVSALTPETDTEMYLLRFQQHAWELFQEHVYDEATGTAGTADSDDEFSFELNDDDAPHHPLPIYWTRGLAAGASLRTPWGSTVQQAYAAFLKRFGKLADFRAARASR